jgi:hypothetical protein
MDRCQMLATARLPRASNGGSLSPLGEDVPEKQIWFQGPRDQDVIATDIDRTPHSRPVVGMPVAALATARNKGGLLAPLLTKFGIAFPKVGEMARTGGEAGATLGKLSRLSS